MSQLSKIDKKILVTLSFFKLKLQVSEIHDGKTDIFEVLIEKGKEAEETKVVEVENVEPGLGKVQFNQTIIAFK